VKTAADSVTNAVKKNEESSSSVDDESGDSKPESSTPTA
jgi:hypothetical protein